MQATKHHSYKPILSILGISAVITAAFIISQQTLSPQPVGINEVASNGTVSLYASPTTVLIRPDVEKSMAISVVADTDKLTGVHLEVEYNPSAVTLSNFSNSNYLSNTIESPVTAQGVVKATFGASVESGGIQGRGPLAWYTVKALKPGTSTINFGPNTLAYAVSLPTNALKEVHSATIKALHPGDATGDDKVNLADYNVFLPAYNSSGEKGFSLADFSNNGKIDLADYNILVGNFGKTYP